MLLTLSSNITHIKKPLNSPGACTIRHTKYNSLSKCMHADGLHVARYSIRKHRHSEKKLFVHSLASLQYY